MHEGIITEVSLKHKRKRLDEVSSILKNVEVLPKIVKSNKIVLGSWVEVEDEEGMKKKYRLVHPLEAAPGEGLLSIESPLGKKLIGKKSGQKFRFKKVDFQILTIK